MSPQVRLHSTLEDEFLQQRRGGLIGRPVLDEPEINRFAHCDAPCGSLVPGFSVELLRPEPTARIHPHIGPTDTWPRVGGPGISGGFNMLDGLHLRSVAPCVLLGWLLIARCGCRESLVEG